MDNEQNPSSQDDRETYLHFYVAGTLFPLLHLEQPVDNAFINLYAAHFGGQTYDLRIFEDTALSFFTRNRNNWNMHDQFFTNFTRISHSYFSQGRYEIASSVWIFALSLAQKWERQNQAENLRIHKGTPFYWLGVISIQKGNLDAGFSYMHRAMLEDYLTNKLTYKNLPPFLLASLDYENKRQAFHEWVKNNSDFLDKLLQTYRTDNAKKLTLDNFRDKFLMNPPTDETLFLFSYTLGRLYRLDQISYDALTTQFSGQIELNLLFNLTIVIDETIDAKNPNPNTLRRDFNVHVGHLSREAGLNLNQQQYQDIANTQPFDATLQRLLDGSFSTVNISTCPSGLEKDISIAFLIRNHGAHNASREQTLWNNFVKVRQSMFNMLFLAIEQLY